MSCSQFLDSMWCTNILQFAKLALICICCLLLFLHSLFPSLLQTPFSTVKRSKFFQLKPSCLISRPKLCLDRYKLLGLGKIHGRVAPANHNITNNWEEVIKWTCLSWWFLFSWVNKSSFYYPNKLVSTIGVEHPLRLYNLKGYMK